MNFYNIKKRSSKYINKINRLSKKGKKYYLNNKIKMELIDEGGTSFIYYDGRHVIKKFQYGDEDDYIFNNEVNILNNLKNNKYIIQMIKYDKKQKSIFLEYAQNGNLYNYLSQNENITKELKNKWVYQLVCAINVLHNNNIIHGDLKTLNILLNSNNDIKLCDFESSFAVNNPIKGEYFVFNKYYSSPEWKNKIFFKQSNIYTLGLIIIEIWTCISPQNIINVKIPEDMPLYLQNIIKKCLNKNPEKRLEINDIKKILEENK